MRLCKSIAVTILAPFSHFVSILEMALTGCWPSQSSMITAAVLPLYLRPADMETSLPKFLVKLIMVVWNCLIMELDLISTKVSSVEPSFTMMRLKL